MLPMFELMPTGWSRINYQQLAARRWDVGAAVGGAECVCCGTPCWVRAAGLYLPE
jgi:hypothetical protein